VEACAARSDSACWIRASIAPAIRADSASFSRISSSIGLS